MKDEDAADELKAPLRVILRCVWRARVLAAITAKGSGEPLAGVSFLVVCFLGWIAYRADPAGVDSWALELTAYGLGMIVSAPKAALEGLASGQPWAWVAAACLAARARWLWLGLSGRPSPIGEALRANAPVAYWLALPWLAAGEANQRLAFKALEGARSFAASSRTLPAQMAAGLGFSLIGGLAIVDTLALMMSAAASWLFMGMVMMMALGGEVGPLLGAASIIFAAALPVWIKRGALQAAWASIRSIARMTKTSAGALKTKSKSRVPKGSAWSGFRRAKAILARGLLESAASDGTLSQAERDALLSATKRKGSDQASKSPSLRL